MNVDVAALDASVRAMLATRTGRPVGLGEPPEQPSTYPWFVLAPTVGATWSGSFQNPLDMADVTYQLTSVGLIYTQAVAAEARAIGALADNWKDIAGACGVPEVSRRGTVRVQDNLWQSVIVFTLKVSAA